MQLAKVQHVKQVETKSQRTQFDAHSALVEQYTTLNFLTQVAKCIDDLHYDNFHVPILLHQERVLRVDCINSYRSTRQPRDENEYIDAKPVRTYSTPDFHLRTITSAEELKRLVAVNQAFRLAINKKIIPLSLLKRALTADQFREFHQNLDEVVELSEIQYGDGMPRQLRIYNKMLSQADLVWGRYQRISEKRGATKAARATEELAESLYEKALEYLEEFFECAKRGDFGAEMPERLQSWMDRPLDFDEGVNRMLNINVHDMPRVRGSKSLYALDSGLPKLSKRLKRQYVALRELIAAGCEIAVDFPSRQSLPDAQEDVNLLRSKLKSLIAKESN